MTELNDKYWPFLQTLLKNGVSQIRNCACLSVVKLLKVNYYEKKRLDIVKHVNEHFFKSKSYFLRMVYLDFVSFSTAFFSQNFLRLHIIPECFKLASDRVPNVRRKLAAILPQIRKRIDQSDPDNFAKFNETIATLKKDLDIDVFDVLLFPASLFSKLNSRPSPKPTICSQNCPSKTSPSSRRSRPSRPRSLARTMNCVSSSSRKTRKPRKRTLRIWTSSTRATTTPRSWARAR